jgi:hypothetical protein
LSLALFNGLRFILLDELCVLTIEDLSLLPFLKVFEGVRLLSSLSLHQEHAALLGLLQLLGQFFLLLLFLDLFLLLLLFVFQH